MRPAPGFVREGSMIWRLAVLLFLGGSAAAAKSAEVEEDAVTYGSVIKFRHSESKFWLHSHTINWGSGSGQQSVTAHGGEDDQGSFWVVKEGQSGSSVEAGEPVMCGAIVRIGHLQTERNLHSHLFSSPLSNQQEVSCFGEGGRGDTGDDWEVVCTEKSKAWRRGKDVRLKHRDTGRFLHSHTQFRFTQRNCPNCPIIGQQEVTAFNAANPQNLWRADQGVFFHPRKDETCEDE